MSSVLTVESGEMFHQIVASIGWNLDRRRSQRLGVLHTGRSQSREDDESHCGSIKRVEDRTLENTSI